MVDHPVHLRHVIADAELVLEEEGGAEALEHALGHDGLAVGQDVRLVHEVRRQQDHLPLLPVLQHGPQVTEGSKLIIRSDMTITYWIIINYVTIDDHCNGIAEEG